MNLVTHFLPQKEAFRSILDANLKNDCIKANQTHYKELGWRIHRSFPLTINTLAVTILIYCSTPFATTYCEALAKRFVRLCKREKLLECEQKIHDMGAFILRPMKKHPTITRCHLACDDSFYIKSSKYHPAARGILEELIWKCGKALDLEHYFAPTRITDTFECVQLGIDGYPLSELLDDNFIGLEKKQVITGLILTLAFGFTDAHSENIILDRFNQIHFADNARCLPHSNGCISVPIKNEVPFDIQKHTSVVAAFRSGLMESSFVYDELTEEDWVLMQELIIRFNERCPKILKKIESIETDYFPPYWFDKDMIVNALCERLAIMETCIQKRNFICLRDLVFKVHPVYRFFVGLSLASQCRDNRFVAKVIDSVSLNSAKNLALLQMYALKDVCGNGFELQDYLLGPTRVPIMDLWHECTDWNKPFDEVIRWISSGDETLENSIEDAQIIIDALNEAANYDFKT